MAMQGRRVWSGLGMGAALWVFLAASAWGQQITAGLRGTVSDPTGAVVAGAKVSARNVATAYNRETDTDSTGGYVFTLLPVGTYDLTVTMSGFKKYVQTGIVLTVNQVAGVNVALEVGAVTQQVEVNAAPVIANTQTSEVGVLLGAQQISELPLDGRNPIALAGLTNGVTQVKAPTYLGAPDAGSVGDNIDGKGSTMVVNGVRWHQTQFNLDGGEFAGVGYDNGLMYPNPDALQEFRFVTGNYSADMGRLPGGVMNVVTKSGTNQYHGDVWEFNRNSALATTGTTAKPAFLNQNQFGFTMGGPVVKNKLFMFGSAEWLRIAQQAVTEAGFAPTAAERSGDLSAFYKNPIIDPATGQPFANNFIDPARFDPIAVKLLNLWPLPNLPNGTLEQLRPAPTHTYEYLLKGDYQIRQSNRLSASFFRNHVSHLARFGRNSASGFEYVNTTGPQGVDNGGMVSSMIVNDTHVFKSNLLNHIRWSYTRIRTLKGQAQKVGPTMHDLDPTFPDFPLVDRPSIWVSSRGFESTGAWGTSDSDDYQVSDSINYIRGAHNLKFGGEYRRATLAQNITGQNAQIYWSGLINVTGSDLADFMLGRTFGIIQSPSVVTRSQNSFGGYIADDYKVSRRLVLNLGLRYQVSPFYTPTILHALSDGTQINGLAYYRPGQQSTIFKNAPLGYLYAGDPGVPLNGASPDYRDLAPRLGFAWDIFGTGKTSLRGAFGLFYDSRSPRYGIDGDIGLPFGQNTKTQVLDHMAGFPGSSYWPPAPFDRNMSFANFYPMQLSSGGSEPINPHDAVVNQYNLTIEQQFAHGVVVSVGYVGNQAHHLTWSRDLNPAVYIPGTDANGNPLSTGDNTDARRRLNLAMPQTPPIYGPVPDQEDSANSSYNSLDVQVRGRNFHGLTIQGNYTWSKAIDEISLYFHGLPSNGVQNPDCRSCERGLASFNQAQALVLSYVYNVPSLTRAVHWNNGAVKRVVDDWELSGISSFVTGNPFSISSPGTDNSRIGQGKDRANVTGDWRLPSGRSRAAQMAEWFNTAVFTANPIGTFGNSARDLVIGPGAWGTDFALVKNIALWGEDKKLQLRFEFFDFFNHANLGTPGTTPGTASFGVISTVSGRRIVQIGGKIFF